MASPVPQLPVFGKTGNADVDRNFEALRVWCEAMARLFDGKHAGLVPPATGSAAVSLRGDGTWA